MKTSKGKAPDLGVPSIEDEAFAEAVAMIAAAQQQAFQAVSTTLIDLYWNVGEYINRKLASAEWSDVDLDQLDHHGQESQMIETRRSIGKAPDKERVRKQETEKQVENLTIAKRMLLTQREALELDSFAPSLAARVGTPIKLSHILRSAIRLVIENQSEILTEADKVKFRRPANGDMKGIEEFEMELAKVVLAGIKKGRG